MKHIAFVFTSSPHGTSAGREGLDALLAASAYTDDIGLFFIGDGILQILPAQVPDKILARDYIATFGLLALYEIDQCYLCAASARERGLSGQIEWVIDVDILEKDALKEKLHQFDVILNF